MYWVCQYCWGGPAAECKQPAAPGECAVCWGRAAAECAQLGASDECTGCWAGASADGRQLGASAECAACSDRAATECAQSDKPPWRAGEQLRHPARGDGARAGACSPRAASAACVFASLAFAAVFALACLSCRVFAASYFCFLLLFWLPPLLPLPSRDHVCPSCRACLEIAFRCFKRLAHRYSPLHRPPPCTGATRQALRVSDQIPSL